VAAARKRARRKPARQRTSRERDVKLPKWSLELMERQVDREITRWARKLLLVIDGEVKKLTEEQVQWLVQASKRGSRTTRRKKPRS
jgi:hypothetical protein